MGYYISGNEKLEDMGGFLQWVAGVGKGAVNVGQTMAPIAGAAGGFYFGGPAGAQIGYQAGSMVSQIGKKPGETQPATPPGGPQTIIMGPSTGGQAAQPTIYMQPPQQKSAFPIPTWALITGGVGLVGLTLFLVLRRKK